MYNFSYGSRVIENEQQVRLHSNVRKIGNLLQAVVRLFVTLFLFVAINVLLSNLVQHANLTFVKMLHLVQEGAELLFSHSAMSAATTFIYHHSFCLMLAVAFFCISLLGLVLIKVLGERENNFEREMELYSKDSKEFCAQTCDTTVSYRQKVCFLA